MKITYVLDQYNKPLMPTKRIGRVRHWLKNKEAIIVDYEPFTIKFIKNTTNYTQDLTLGLDTGRTNIGAAVTKDDCECLYSALVETNNKLVTKHMTERKQHRQASRRGERKRRQRRAIKCNTIMNPKIRERMLPGCAKPIVIKYIKNSESKFNNRSKLNLLPPTVRHLILTHVNLVEKVQKILPITKVIVELNKFDFQKLDNATISGVSYTKGTLSGFDSLKDYINYIQKDNCMLCKNKIEHYHHIIPQSKGGSDTHHNITGLCNKCHDKVHKNSKYEVKLKTIKEGVLKRYSGSAIINIAMPYIIEELKKLGVDVITTYGYETKVTRDKYTIPKDHDYDAYAISLKDCTAISIKVPVLSSFNIKQYRRHNRANIYAQRERTYKLDGVLVAKNHNKRTEQKENSLKEFRSEYLHKYGRAKYTQMLGKLEAIKSTRRYKQQRELSEGCVVLLNNERFVVTGSSGAGKYVRLLGLGKKDVSIKSCKLIKKNEGLVYL